jgi:hypothetical protein
MRACQNVIPYMLVIRVGRNLGMAGSIIIPED